MADHSGDDGLRLSCPLCLRDEPPAEAVERDKASAFAGQLIIDTHSLPVAAEELDCGHRALSLRADRRYRQLWEEIVTHLLAITASLDQRHESRVYRHIARSRFSLLRFELEQSALAIRNLQRSNGVDARSRQRRNPHQSVQVLWSGVLVSFVVHAVKELQEFVISECARSSFAVLLLRQGLLSPRVIVDMPSALQPFPIPRERAYV